MAVLVVVVVEEPGAEGPGVLDRTEPLREGGEVLEGLEAGLGVEVVVGDVGAGHPQVQERLGHRLGGHR